MKSSKTGRVQFLNLVSHHLTKRGLQLIEDAYTLSKYGHRNQKRDQGERYFEHPKQVALIVVNELKTYDSKMIIMALLHDILEDTFILSKKGIEKLFGKRVTSGLDFLTKKGTRESYVKKLQKCKDVRVIIVKLSDRLHNLRTLENCTKKKREKIVSETRISYLPLIDSFLKKTKSKNYLNAIEYLKKEITKSLEELLAAK